MLMEHLQNTKYFYEILTETHHAAHMAHPWHTYGMNMEYLWVTKGMPIEHL